MVKQINLQDSFLNQLRKDNISAVFYLVNGFQMKGHVKGFDNYVVIIESDGKNQLVYKHAVSTIIPTAHINFYPTAKNQTPGQGEIKK